VVEEAVLPGLTVSSAAVAERKQFLFDSSIAASTLAIYQKKWDFFIGYCKDQQLQFLPPVESTISSYIAHLSFFSKSVVGLEQTMAAITYFCQAAGVICPNSGTLSRLTKGFKAAYGKPAVQKTPLTVENIHSMVDLAYSSNDIVTMRSALIASVTFLQCLRFSEFVDIRVSDVKRVDNKFIVNVRSSKTSKKGFTFEIEIDQRNRYCSGVLFLNYLLKAGISLSGIDRPLFGRLITSSSGYSTHVKAVTKSTLSSQFKKLLSAIGLDPTKYGTHSCRRGHATESAAQGASVSSLRQAGRWSYNSMTPFLYVEHSEVSNRDLRYSFAS
jgi:integrase